MSERTGEWLPLRGVRVVAVEQAIAAPLATRHLADLGADIIKIERPDGGDFARDYDSGVDDVSSWVVWRLMPCRKNPGLPSSTASATDWATG